MTTYRRLRCMVYLIISLGLTTSMFGQQFGAAVSTTVCALSKNPERYAKFKTVVRVRAFILSDLKHATLLADAACDKVGVSLESDEFENRPIDLVKDNNYDELEELHPKIPELRSKGQKIYGTFEGLFEWHPDRRRGPVRTLVLRQVTNLYVGAQDSPKYAHGQR